jgi:hypothetical protein
MSSHPLSHPSAAATQHCARSTCSVDGETFFIVSCSIILSRCFHRHLCPTSEQIVMKYSNRIVVMISQNGKIGASVLKLKRKKLYCSRTSGTLCSASMVPSLSDPDSTSFKTRTCPPKLQPRVGVTCCCTGTLLGRRDDEALDVSPLPHMKIKAVHFHVRIPYIMQLFTMCLSQTIQPLSPLPLMFASCILSQVLCQHHEPSPAT